MQEKDLEEFEKEFIKNEQEYFKKNFLVKPFYQAMYENTRKSILLLLRAQLSFVLLKDSFTFLKNDKNFFKTLGKKDKNTLNQMIKGTSCIISALDEILLPISESLK